MARIPFLPTFQPVRAQTTNGERQYLTDLGYLSSVTTVLSGSRDNSGLAQWRESIGEERADEILAVACHRGTEQHLNIENYFRHGIEPKATMLQDRYWKSVRPFLDTVDQVLSMEGACWHPDGYAGAYDCIAYLNDDTEPTLLDWKTADKERNKSKIYEYSLQVAAYVNAANYIYKSYGLDIQKAKIVVALPAQKPQIVDLNANDLRQYYLHFLARLKRFTFARQ